LLTGEFSYVDFFPIGSGNLAVW